MKILLISLCMFSIQIFAEQLGEKVELCGNENMTIEELQSHSSKQVSAKPKLSPSCARFTYQLPNSEGRVVSILFEFNLNSSGTATSTNILKGSGITQLDVLAKNHFSKCKFEPEKINGKYVESKYKVKFTWKVEGGKL